MDDAIIAGCREGRVSVMGPHIAVALNSNVPFDGFGGGGEEEVLSSRVTRSKWGAMMGGIGADGPDFGEIQVLVPVSRLRDVVPSSPCVMNKKDRFKRKWAVARGKGVYTTAFPSPQFRSEVYNLGDRENRIGI